MRLYTNIVLVVLLIVVLLSSIYSNFQIEKFSKQLTAVSDQVDNLNVLFSELAPPASDGLGVFKKASHGKFMLVYSTYYSSPGGREGWWKRLAHGTDTVAPLSSFDGLMLKINWRDLEPVQGQYDFSFIEESLFYAKKYNKSLGLMLETRSFESQSHGLSTIVPDYVLANPDKYGLGNDRDGNTVGGMYYVNPTGFAAKNTIMWWNPKVFARLKKLIESIAYNYDDNPLLKMFLTSETATGIRNYPNESKEAMALRLGYSGDVAEKGLKRFAYVYSRSFKKTPTFIWLNHFNPGYEEGARSPEDYIISVGNTATRRGVGMGGPDLINFEASNGEKKVSDVMAEIPLYKVLTPERVHKWSSNAPLAFGVMDMSYEFADNLRDGKAVNRYWTMNDLLKYGEVQLGASFFIVVPRNYWKGSKEIESDLSGIHQLN